MSLPADGPHHSGPSSVLEPPGWTNPYGEFVVVNYLSHSFNGQICWTLTLPVEADKNLSATSEPAQTMLSSSGWELHPCPCSDVAKGKLQMEVTVPREALNGHDSSSPLPKRHAQKRFSTSGAFYKC